MCFRKIITLNPNTRCQKNASTQSEEISLVSSSYLSKIAMLEAENEKLKVNLNINSCYRYLRFLLSQFLIFRMSFLGWRKNCTNVG